MGAQGTKKRVIVQVACGFSRKPQSEYDFYALSMVDYQRAVGTIINYKIGDEVFVTGMVPYDANQSHRTLASLNTELLEKSFKLDEVTIQSVSGLNAFSESWNACKLARQHRAITIVVVTSDFYLEAYRRMWLAAGQRNGLEVQIFTISHTNLVDKSVWEFYRGWKAQALSRMAASSTLGHWLAMMLADQMTKKRLTEGFKLDGHTAIG